MRSVETDTIQTIYLPSIVTQASLSLSPLCLYLFLSLSLRSIRNALPLAHTNTRVRYQREDGNDTGARLATRGIRYASRGKSAVFLVYFPF